MNQMIDWQLLRSRAYVPYSGHREVAVCISDTHLYSGVRIESIAFPDIIDAIQSAWFSCLSEGDQPRKIILPPGKPGHSVAMWKRIMNIPIEQSHTLPELPVYNPLKKSLDEDNILPFMKGLCDNAITPASDFPVVSLIQTENGLISGVNIELDIWRLGLCAERIALTKAIACGYTTFNHVHVYAPKAEYISPCGACRQVLTEHMAQAMITQYHGDDTESEMKLDQMLPYSFHSSSLTNRKQK